MNADERVIGDFGREWDRFDQSSVSESELRRLFDEYFELFPWNALPRDAKGFDLGCGSGRWARFVAPRVGTLVCIDPSIQALNVARRKIEASNVEFQLSDVDNIQGSDYDFGYSLGVLHHIPDTQAGLAKCVESLKPGAPFLVYLYYRFDNKPYWFKALWKITDLFRRLISQLPFRLKALITDLIAVIVYWPLARASRSLPFLPLSQYKDVSFYVMRTDALDRFGTKTERRFTKSEILLMMRNCGLERITFSFPYWTALGYKKALPNSTPQVEDNFRA